MEGWGGPWRGNFATLITGTTLITLAGGGREAPAVGCSKSVAGGADAELAGGAAEGNRGDQGLVGEVEDFVGVHGAGAEEAREPFDGELAFAGFGG